MNYPKADPLNFLGIRDEICELKNSKVAIFPIPYESTTSFLKGTSQAPLRIIEVSDHLELYEEEMGWEPWKIGITTLESIETVHDVEEMMRRIKSATKWLISLNKFPVFIGGEHTISFPIVEAFKNSRTKFSVIQLDAHADLKDIYEGTRLSHACVMRRITELGVKIAGVGIRAISSEEVEFIRNNPDKYKLFEIEDLESPLWKDELMNFLEENVYISVDLDVFDPSEIPSVGNPEPGGMRWKEIISIIKNICRNKRIIGADFTELAPRPSNQHSEYAVAKLIYKLISFVFG